MKRLFLLGLFLTVVACPAFPQFTFTSLDFPGGTLTTARGINNQGEIVGAYRITPPRHAMLIHAGNYIPLAPTSILGTHFSEAFKMNDSGEVVGEFNGDDGFTHGYLLNGGNWISPAPVTQSRLDSMSPARWSVPGTWSIPLAMSSPVTGYVEGRHFFRSRFSGRSGHQRDRN